MPLRLVLALARTGADLSLLVCRDSDGGAGAGGAGVSEAAPPPPLHSLLQLRIEGADAAAWERCYRALLAVHAQPGDALLMLRALESHGPDEII